MAEFDAFPLFTGDAVSVWNCVCPGSHEGKSDEECTSATHMVFPYQGIYVNHVGRHDFVAEANQVSFLNANEPYRVSHPVAGGDATLSIGLSEATLSELAPKAYLRSRGQPGFNRPGLRIGPDTQARLAILRYRLSRCNMEDLEAEILTLDVLRSALHGTFCALAGGRKPQTLVTRVKLLLASDLSRRWTLTDIAAKVGRSPVYLTQVFAQLEGTPLYQYQLQLRLARALALLEDYDELAFLSNDLGFSSHSHFSSAFKKAYGQAPSDFRRSARIC